MNAILPHTNSYARLGPSKISGIGVFAIRDIPEGTSIFVDDQLDVSWFDKKIVDESTADSEELRRLYTDFCVLKNGKYGCPINFNSITMAWYINEPTSGGEPNVYADEKLNFIAKRKIEKGEELTVFYSAYSDPVHRY